MFSAQHQCYDDGPQKAPNAAYWFYMILQLPKENGLARGVNLPTNFGSRDVVDMFLQIRLRPRQRKPSQHLQPLKSSICFCIV